MQSPRGEEGYLTRRCTMTEFKRLDACTRTTRSPALLHFRRFCEARRIQNRKPRAEQILSSVMYPCHPRRLNLVWPALLGRAFHLPPSLTCSHPGPLRATVEG